MKLSKCHSDELFIDQLGYSRCNTCLLKADSKFSFRIAFIIIFGAILLCGFSLKDKSIGFNGVIPIIGDTCDLILNDSVILQELRKDSIICPEIVLNQIKIETNYYKSTVCLQNHNLIGLKYIARKPYQIKELNNHAYYSSYRNSLKDYKLTQGYYLENLQKKYSESKDYSKLIKSIK